MTALRNQIRYKPNNALLSFQLSGWLWTEIAHPEGFAGSINDNPNAAKISLPPVLKTISTKQTATG